MFRVAKALKETKIGKITREKHFLLINVFFRRCLL